MCKNKIIFTAYSSVQYTRTTWIYTIVLDMILKKVVFNAVYSRVHRLGVREIYLSQHHRFKIACIQQEQELSPFDIR